MPCEVRVDAGRGLVIVRCWGEYVTTEHEAVRRDCFRTCRQYGLHRILVDLLDVEASPTVSTMELYDFGTSFRDEESPGGIVLGVVPPHGQASRSDMTFITTVASNRGIPIKLFDEIEQAAEWLCEQV